VNIYDEYDLPASIDNQQQSTSKNTVKTGSSLSLDQNDFTQFRINRESIRPASSFSIPEITIKDFSSGPRPKLRADDVLNVASFEMTKNQSVENIRNLSLSDSISQINDNQSRMKYSGSVKKILRYSK